MCIGHTTKSAHENMQDWPPQIEIRVYSTQQLCSRELPRRPRRASPGRRKVASITYVFVRAVLPNDVEEDVISLGAPSRCTTASRRLNVDGNPWVRQGA